MMQRQTLTLHFRRDRNAAQADRDTKGGRASIQVLRGNSGRRTVSV